MSRPVLDAIVVGAGHAGLCASFQLKNSGINHLVLERGRIGESWLSQRWDSFRLNSANKMNELPAPIDSGLPPDEFATHLQFAKYLTQYAKHHELPIQEGTSVVSIEQSQPRLFRVCIIKNDVREVLYSRNIIIAAGFQNKMKLPSLSATIDPSFFQLHASEYRSARQLPTGAVLVVGSAQSGCQIAADLTDSGRKVFLSTSKVGRLPRHYRGRDILDWLFEMKFFDMRPQDVPDPAMLHSTAPQLTGAGTGKETISLQSLATKGVKLTGRIHSADMHTVSLIPNLKENLNHADVTSVRIKEMIDDFILKGGIEAPVAKEDLNDVPVSDEHTIDEPIMINLKEEGIGAIIWATGLDCDFSFIKLPVTDSKGHPVHKEGKTDIAGLYFIGLPWLRKRKSALIAGAAEDAAFICEDIRQSFLDSQGSRVLK